MGRPAAAVQDKEGKLLHYVKYRKLDTDDEDVELGSLTPKLSDLVAEQERLLKQRPVYADDSAPLPGTWRIPSSPGDSVRRAVHG